MGQLVQEKGHALIVPFPLQGHITPMMQLAQKLVSDGFIVTFVNSEHNHSRIMEAKKKMKLQADHANKEADMRMVSIPNTLPPELPQGDILKLLDSSMHTLAYPLHKLIQDHINRNEKLTCLIFDIAVHYVRNVAKHFDIPYAIFSPASVATAATSHLPSTLISSGILSPKGTAKVKKMIKVLPSMPPLHSTQFAWMFGSEADIHKTFEFTLANGKEIRSDLILFNSFSDLEAPIINEYPEKSVVVCPIGPLIPWRVLDGDSETQPGALRVEETECLDWLDKQLPLSVVYVSFGSLAMLKERQFEELAMGLEATGRPFLLVLRSDLMEGTTPVFPHGFLERVGDRGCLVSWASQLSVLSHPSIACFVTHCGWNSTVESISMGVPMLCWPQFMDQFLNCSYIVNEWKIGLQLIGNSQGIIEKREIENAVEKLLVGEEGIEMKKRVTLLKNSARASVNEGGSSFLNYNRFLEAMQSKRI